MSLGKLGDVEFEVIPQESDTFTNNITDFSLEDGSTVTDHVQNIPIVINITASLTGPTVGQKLNKLKDYWLNKELLTFTYNINLDNVVIQNLQYVFTSKYAQGCDVTLVLKQLKFSAKEEINIDTSKLTIPEIKTKAKSSAGRKSKASTETIKVDNAALNARIKELTKY